METGDVDEDAVDFDNRPAELEVYHDNIPVKVNAARREKDFLHEFGVHRKISRASADGGQFVTVIKGDEQRPEYRRLHQARELKVWDSRRHQRFARSLRISSTMKVLS